MRNGSSELANLLDWALELRLDILTCSFGKAFDYWTNFSKTAISNLTPSTSAETPAHTYLH